MSFQRTYDGDEMFWFDTTMLMVDATMADHELKQRERFKKCKSILVHALNVYVEVAATRPTKTALSGFIMAKLRAKFGCSCSCAQHDHDICAAFSDSARFK